MLLSTEFKETQNDTTYHKKQEWCFRKDLWNGHNENTKRRQRDAVTMRKLKGNNVTINVHVSAYLCGKGWLVRCELSMIISSSWMICAHMIVEMNKIWMDHGWESLLSKTKLNSHRIPRIERKYEEIQLDRSTRIRTLQNRKFRDWIA